MRDHSLVAARVLERRDRYERERKRRKKVFTGAACLTACLCIFLSAGLAVWKASADKAGSPASGITIEFNRAGDYSANAADIAPLMDDFVPFTREEAAEYYGTDVCPEVPGDLSENAGLLGIFKRDGGAGEVYHSTFQLSYSTEDQSRAVWIAGDRNKAPLTDTVIEYDRDDMKATEIDGQKVYFIDLSDLRDGLVLADFRYKGVYFSVNMAGLSEDEMVSVVSSLLD